MFNTAFLHSYLLLLSNLLSNSTADMLNTFTGCHKKYSSL